MKKCYRCGTVWQGYGRGPRTREACEGCGGHLRCCSNCHYLDRASSSCTHRESSFIGPRGVLNYCEFFKMTDTRIKEKEARVTRARDRWEALFGG